MKRRFPIKVLTVAIILGSIATPSAFASASFKASKSVNDKTSDIVARESSLGRVRA
jgi:hypothetical protein